MIPFTNSRDNFTLIYCFSMKSQQEIEGKQICLKSIGKQFGRGQSNWGLH